MLWKIWRWWKFIKSSRESRNTARHCVFSLSTRLIQNTCRLTSSGLLLVHAQRVHKFCFSYFLLYEWRSESGEDWRPEIRETERREERSEKWQLDSIFWDDGRTLVFREKDEKLDEWILFHQRHHTHATEWSVKCVMLSELNSVERNGETCLNSMRMSFNESNKQRRGASLGCSLESLWQLFMAIVHLVRRSFVYDCEAI